MWDLKTEAAKENLSHHMVSTLQSQLHIWTFNPGLRKANHKQFLSTRAYRDETRILDITMWELTNETNETNRNKFTMKQEMPTVELFLFILLLLSLDCDTPDIFALMLSSLLSVSNTVVVV